MGVPNISGTQQDIWPISMEFVTLAFCVLFLILLAAYLSENRGGNARRAQSGLIRRSAYTLFHQFIQKVIRWFEKQRRVNYQFAVLFLSSQYNEENIANEMRFRTTNGMCNRNNATDSRYSTFPPSKELCNYITARPSEDGRHAEKLILDNFEKLFWNYRNNYNLKSIVLYTWLLPCKTCQEQIVRVLRPHVSYCNVMVVYSSEGQQNSHQVQSVCNGFEQAGITVKLERCDFTLGPK